MERKNPSKDGNKPRKPAVRKAADENARVHKNLEGFQIGINTFGEISSNVAVERINEFLNKNVPDRRLTDSGPESGTEAAYETAG